MGPNVNPRESVRKNGDFPLDTWLQNIRYITFILNEYMNLTTVVIYSVTVIKSIDLP